MNFRRYDTFLFFFRKHDMVDVYILCFQKWNNNMISTCTIRSSFCSCEKKNIFSHVVYTDVAGAIKLGYRDETATSIS